MRTDEFTRALIDAREDFDRRIEALEAELMRRPPRRDDDPRAARLHRLTAARERVEARILADYPER